MFQVVAGGRGIRAEDSELRPPCGNIALTGNILPVVAHADINHAVGAIITFMFNVQEAEQVMQGIASGMLLVGTQP